MAHVVPVSMTSLSVPLPRLVSALGLAAGCCLLLLVRARSRSKSASNCTSTTTETAAMMQANLVNDAGVEMG